jgi:uncharacterized protein YkwD
MSTRIRAASVLTAAAFVAILCAQATGAALVPPVPPLSEPLGSLLGGNPPAQTSGGPPAASSAQSAPSSPAAARAATTTSAATALERLVTAQINVVRHNHHLARLIVSPQLSRAGREHAERLALAGYFSHDWSDGTPFGTWIRRFYPVGSAHRWSAGENLAWSTPEVTAQQAVDMWLASPEHRRILLSKTWRQVGLGVIRAEGAGGVYDGQSVVILAAEFGIRR